MSLEHAIERLRNALQMHNEHRTTMQSLAGSVADFLRDAATLKAAQGGVTEAMVRRVADALSIAGWDIGGDREDFEADIRDALEAALSAEPAANLNEPSGNSGELPEPAAWIIRKRNTHPMDSVAHCTTHEGDAAYHIERGDDVTPLYTAPPAQPAERVPDGWKLAMLVLQSDLYRKLPEEERAVCDALVAENPYIAATPAAPAEEGDGKCATCEGHKYVNNGRISIECFACGGTGKATGAAR